MLFTDDSLLGLELELVAPPGGSREALAQALAREVSGSVAVQLKASAWEERGSAGPRRMSVLTLGYVVTGAQGGWVASFLDDVTLTADLDPSVPPRSGAWRLFTARPEVADSLEKSCVRGEATPERVLGAWLEKQGARLEPLDSSGALRRVLDPSGGVLAVVAPEPGERERACELVTAPLRRAEAGPSWQALCGLAARQGFVPASDGGLHAHLDAAPWRSSARLARLIRTWNARRSELLGWLAPNPRSERSRGPFPANVETIAQGAEALPFEVFAQMLLACRPPKRLDVNVHGVISPDAKQPTLEVRCLAPELDSERTLARLRRLENFLEGLAA